MAIRLTYSGSAGAGNAVPILAKTHSWQEEQVMVAEQGTFARPFFQPLPEQDDLQTALLLRRLADKVLVAEDGCWIWNGCRNPDGYGQAGVGGRKTELVHRIVHRICVGPIQIGQEVCHNCPAGDNPSCVNPAHLFVGTHTDNMRDASRKGRIKARDSAGEKNPSAKLNWNRVRSIRARYAALRLQGASNPARRLAEEEQVSEPTIRRVVNNVIWKEVG